MVEGLLCGVVLAERVLEADDERVARVDDVVALAAGPRLRRELEAELVPALQLAALSVNVNPERGTELKGSPVFKHARINLTRCTA